MSEKEYKSQAQKTLPYGWSMVKFGDVVRYVKTDANPENSGLERYVAGEHMQTDDLHIKQWGIIGAGYLGPAFHRKFVKGQVLYGSRRTYLRKVAIAEFDGICANTTFVLESKDGELLPELLPFVMQSDSFAEHSVKKSKGSVNPYINWKDIAIYEFPLPPKDEQRRIADIFWAAEDCIVKNEKLVEKAEFYNKTLMTELLTKGIGHRDFKDTEIGRIPVDWTIDTLPNLMNIIDYRGRTPPFSESGIPYVGADNIKNKKIIFENQRYVSEETYNKYMTRGIPNPGDILFTTEAPLGEVAIVPNNFKFCFAQRSVALQCKNKFNSKFFMYLLVSKIVQKQLRDWATGTTVRGISSKNLKFIKIPYSKDIEEQRCIADILSKLDDSIQKAQENINQTKELKKMLINQFLNDGLKTTVSTNQQANQLYETQVSE